MAPLHHPLGGMLDKHSVSESSVKNLHWLCVCRTVDKFQKSSKHDKSTEMDRCSHTHTKANAMQVTSTTLLPWWYCIKYHKSQINYHDFVLHVHSLALINCFHHIMNHICFQHWTTVVKWEEVLVWCEVNGEVSHTRHHPRKSVHYYHNPWQMSGWRRKEASGERHSEVPLNGAIVV